MNWVVSYTPPGWALSRAFRDSLSVVAELFLFLPLTVLGFASVAGGSVMGVVALRQIRQAQGQLRGFGLALFDVLFFPLVLLNWWAGWLVWRVVSQTGSGASSLAVAGLTLAALFLNALLIRASWRVAKQFVNSPAPPARPRATGDWSQVFKAAALRLVLVIAVQLALFETLEQVSVHWKESTSELWGMALAVATLGGLIWACWPGYRLKRSWLFCVGGTVVSSLLLLALDNFYSWHLRPNLGLYREADWVARHPGFQRQMRQRIDNNLWRKPVATPAPANEATFVIPPTAQVPSFGPVIEHVVSRHDAEKDGFVFFDLETGTASKPPFPLRLRSVYGFHMAELTPEFLQWVRTNDFDLLFQLEDNRWSCVPLDLKPLKGTYTFEADLERIPASEVTFAAADEEAEDTAYPDPVLNRTYDDEFRFSSGFITRGGTKGILQRTGINTTPRGVKLRYKLVQTPAQQAGKSLVNPKSPTLSFGVETHGLCAAVELKPSGKGFVLGEPIEVRFHIRNTSTSIISIAGTSWRQDEPRYITVQDEQGGMIPVQYIWYSGLARLQRSVLHPGESAVFGSSGLEFLAEDSGEKKVRHPVGNYAKVKPGHYTISYRLKIPDVISPGFSMPHDWQGILDTAPVTVDVNAPAARADAQNLSFGPVIEREISSDLVRLTNWWALNLASGKVMRFDLTRPPDDLKSGLAASDPSTLTLDRRLPSLRAAGVDLFQALAASVPDSVLALDLRLVSLDADGWDISAADAMAQLDKTAAVGVSRSEAFIDGSHVYVFSTRDGAKGVLQISKNTSLAKLRYKLVQPPKLTE